MKNILNLLLKSFGLLIIFFFFSCAFSSAHNYSKEYDFNEYYHYHKCLDEGCNVVDDFISHEYGEEIIVKEATCNEKGEKIKECLVCEYVQSTPIDSYHVMEKVDYKSPTCEEDGNRIYYKCKNCEYLTNDANGKYEVSYNDVKINKLGHDYNSATIKVKNQTDLIDGNVDIQCKRCDKIVSLIIPSFNKTESYDIINIDSTCQEEGKITYILKEEVIKEQLINFLNDDSLYDSFGNLIIHKEEIIEKKAHDHVFVVDFPTYDNYGSTYFVCKNCHKFKLNKRGYSLVEHFGKYDKNKDFITEISNDATCVSEGEIEYVLSKEFVMQRLLDTYDMTVEELTPYVDSVSYYHSFNGKLMTHCYQEVYGIYNGYVNYHIECKYHKEKYLYHNNDLYYTMFPLNENYVIDTTSVLSCEEEGYIAYQLDKEKVYDKIKKDLVLSDDEMEKYFYLVDENNTIYENYEPLGHSYGNGSVVLTYPTDSTYGLLQICCNRENCGEYMQTLSEDDKITLPLVTTNGDAYIINETYSHCTNIGHINYSISLDYLQSLARKHYGEDFDIQIFYRDTKYLLNSTYNLEPLGHQVNLVPKYGTYVDEVTFYCSYCNETLASILKPEFSKETYVYQEVKGNCVTKTYYIYSLDYEKCLELISSYPIFNNQKYSLSDYAYQLKGATEIIEYGSVVPNVHGGSMTLYYDESHPIVRPTYDVMTGNSTLGSCYLQCSCGNLIVSKKIYYNDGYWSYNSFHERFTRYFNVEDSNNQIGGDTRESFTIAIGLNGGSTSKVTYNSYGKSSSTFNFIFSKGDFSKGGKLVDYIDIYIDGVYYSEEELINNGRLSYTYTASRHTGYSIRMWKDLNGNPLPGDVRVVLNYKE